MKKIFIMTTDDKQTDNEQLPISKEFESEFKDNTGGKK